MPKESLPSNLLHEIAGSISGIHGFTTVLKRRMEDNEFLDMVLSAANEAIQTVRDMQLVESIDLGRGAGSPRPCSMSEALPGDVDAGEADVNADPELFRPLFERVRGALTDEGADPAQVKVEGRVVYVLPSGDLAVEDLEDGLRTGRRRFRSLALMKIVAEDWGGTVRIDGHPAFVIELAAPSGTS